MDTDNGQYSINENNEATIIWSCDYFTAEVLRDLDITYIIILVKNIEKCNFVNTAE